MSRCSLPFSALPHDLLTVQRDQIQFVVGWLSGSDQ